MRLVAILLIMVSKSLCLWCIDGSDCDNDPTCSFCEGAACLRVQRQHPIRGLTTAMTCLPHDSLIHAYHPEGCRTELSTGEKLCLCSERDFCNSATRLDLSFVFFFLFLLLL